MGEERARDSESRFTVCRDSEKRDVSKVLILSVIFLNLCISSGVLGSASYADAVGVGALRSATISAIVKSVSCPTAEITGIREA